MFGLVVGILRGARATDHASRTRVFEIVMRWSTGRTRRRTLKRVEIVAEADVCNLSIVSPSGHRLDGLTLQDAIAVSRATSHGHLLVGRGPS
jgi:hypothetical protein